MSKVERHKHQPDRLPPPKTLADEAARYSLADQVKQEGSLADRMGYKVDR